MYLPRLSFLFAQNRVIHAKYLKSSCLFTFSCFTLFAKRRKSIKQNENVYYLNYMVTSYNNNPTTENVVKTITQS